MSLSKDLFKLDLDDALVTIRLDPFKNQKLDFECTACRKVCEHLGAAFSLILEEKMALGLAAPPPERVPTSVKTRWEPASTFCTSPAK